MERDAPLQGEGSDYIHPDLNSSSSWLEVSKELEVESAQLKVKNNVWHLFYHGKHAGLASVSAQPAGLRAPTVVQQSADISPVFHANSSQPVPPSLCSQR